MSLAETFPEITKRDQPLAPFTHLKIGGPAEFLVQPRSVDELNAVLAACQRDRRERDECTALGAYGRCSAQST